LLEREPVHVVSQRLGHASPMVTLMVYANPRVLHLTGGLCPV
jgi:integrase